MHGRSSAEQRLRPVDNTANRKFCQDYLDLPYIKNDEAACAGRPVADRVPKTVFSVAAGRMPPVQVGVTASNPGYQRKHHSDAEAPDYIRERCGEDTAKAYECLAPPAYRADLFRFCALFSEGGVYLDSDMLPPVPLEELYDPCATATVGHDRPQGRPRKRMKILAGVAGAPIFGCMVRTIVRNVSHRFCPDNALAITGPMALHRCCESHPDDVSVTYHDTRGAAHRWRAGCGRSTGPKETPSSHWRHR